MISDAHQSLETLRVEIDKEDARYRDELKKASDDRRIDYARRMHRIWHQLEQPDAGGEDETDPIQAQLEARRSESNRQYHRLGEHDKQLAELAKRVDANHGKIISLTNGVNAHERQFAELTERVNTFAEAFNTRFRMMHLRVAELTKRLDTLSPAPKPEPARNDEGEPCAVCTRCEGTGFVGRYATPACEHPPNRILHWTVVGQGGKAVSWCGLCGDMRYHGDKWSSPELATAAPTPKPACEHPCTGVVRIWGFHEQASGMVGLEVLKCKDCCSVLLSGTWYHPQPPSEKAEGGETEYIPAGA